MKQLINNLARFGLVEIVAAVVITAILFVIALAFGVGDSPTSAAPAPAPAPAVVEVVEASELVDAVVLENLVVAGHAVDYDGSTGAWTIDGVVVGWSDAEDEDFRAVAMLSVIRDAQP